MKAGTKTVLFGTHQFLIHPVLVLIAWCLLYGKPKLHEFIAICIHDLGYWGLPNIDGKEGEQHPYHICDWICKHEFWFGNYNFKFRKLILEEIYGHSRYYSDKENNGILSKLFYADKLAFTLCPMLLYLLLANLSGEIKEYMTNKKYKYWNKVGGQIGWYYSTKEYMLRISVQKFLTKKTKIKVTA